jgi:IS1 family transposase
MLERSSIMYDMNQLSIAKRVQVIAALVEGNSIRSTERMTGVAKNTILHLLADLGTACADFQDICLTDLPCCHIQCDEIWSFCYAKEKNLPEALRGQFGYGSVWTWTAICADCKLVPCWLVGLRDAEYGSVFMQDLARRLAHRVQLTTDGHRAYLEALESAFGADIDYAMLIKLYGAPQDSETRYSPSECIGVQSQRIQGNPEFAHISTSYAERQNLSMRMAMRRMTRLTNGFSKKVENLGHATSLYFMYYNFARIHSALRVTPAMEAKITQHVWTIEEILALLEEC